MLAADGPTGTLRNMGSRRLTAALLAVALGLATPASADRWYEHYARAEAALRAEDWETAIAQLNLALERKGDSGAQVRTYGMRATAYFPYLKLGIAFYHTGQPEAALRAFETEERLGAISASDQARAELERYRSLATEAVQRRQAEQQRRAAEIARDSMAEAEALQRRGQLHEALEAIVRALSVAPENAEVQALAEAIRSELAGREDRRARAARAASLVEQGARLRDEGRLGEAAASFRQAVEIDPDSPARAELAQVLEELAARSAAARRPTTDDALQQARERFEAGHLGDALTLVQEVLGAAPERAAARGLERQILDALAARARQRDLDRLLAEARGLVAVGDHEAAIAAANLALAHDRGNPDALEILRSSYQEVSRRLLGLDARQNIPPAVHFADLRQEQPDGARVQVVREAAFRLSGVVLDETPVRVEVSAGDGRPIPSEVSSQQVGGVQITEFRVSTVLPSGRTVLDVAATDEEGVGSHSEYAVLYRPSALRSPWLWAAVAGLAVLAALVWTGGRVLQRRRLRRRRFNPFVAGPPVLDPELFYGREQLVERILATIPSNSLLLLGERRIGKTSLLHHLRRRLRQLDHPAYRFVPVYVDLQGTPEETFFFVLGDAVLRTVTGKGLATDANRGGYTSLELVNDLRNVLESLQREGGKQARLVLLIDEIDELNGYSHRTNQRLRSLFMRSFADQLVAVAAGVGIDRQWDHQGSPWFNFFEELEVGPLDTEAASRLVTRPLAGVIDLDRPAVERLVEASGGRPYLLQRIALELVQRAHEGCRRRITLADVEALLADHGR